MENNVEIGAKGWIKYRFPDPQEAKIANILAHFAFFSAIGRKTALGMGQTRISHQLTVIS
jgi:CRISPR-associated endoribonuclease Cas6